jgi:hypothetical protein
MTDDAFAKLVAEEVKNKVTNETREILFKQENWDRWERSLIALVENLNGQLQRISEDKEADTERYSSMEEGNVLLSEALSFYEKQAKKIERFKFHVENRLVQVSKMIATGSRFEDDMSKQIVMLRKGIEAHRKMMNDFDLEETAIDRALWDLLSGQWSFNEINSEDI